jgi:hypothetical protein
VLYIKEETRTQLADRLELEALKPTAPYEWPAPLFTGKFVCEPSTDEEIQARCGDWAPIVSLNDRKEALRRRNRSQRARGAS